jgi:hypothetical protein
MTLTDKFKKVTRNVPNGDIPNNIENVSSGSHPTKGEFSNSQVAIILAKLQVALEMAAVAPVFNSTDDINNFCHE